MFVGCLEQDRTMDVLSELLKQAPGAHHYAVVAKPLEDTELYAKHAFSHARHSSYLVPKPQRGSTNWPSRSSAGLPVSVRQRVYPVRS